MVNHDEILAEMVDAMSGNGAEGSDEEVESDLFAALRAAERHGFILTYDDGKVVSTMSMSKLDFIRQVDGRVHQRRDGSDPPGDE